MLLLEVQKTYEHEISYTYKREIYCTDFIKIRILTKIFAA